MSTIKSGEKHSVKAEKPLKQDAIDMLLDDHKRIRKLFKEFERYSAKDEAPNKIETALQLCDVLVVHTVVEEEIFYPAVRAAIDDDHLINEAEVEHASARELLGQIQAMNGSEALYDATVAVLRDHIEYHIEQEEKEMFSKARKSKLDLRKLALAMKQRRDEMTVEFI